MPFISHLTKIAFYFPCLGKTIDRSYIILNAANIPANIIAVLIIVHVRFSFIQRRMINAIRRIISTIIGRKKQIKASGKRYRCLGSKVPNPRSITTKATYTRRAINIGSLFLRCSVKVKCINII